MHGKSKFEGFLLKNLIIIDNAVIWTFWLNSIFWIFSFKLKLWMNCDWNSTIDLVIASYWSVSFLWTYIFKWNILGSPVHSGKFFPRSDISSANFHGLKYLILREFASVVILYSSRAQKHSKATEPRDLIIGKICFLINVSYCRSFPFNVYALCC